eukprot:3002609-Lingulodinium_polyedra.AAC.1
MALLAGCVMALCSQRGEWFCGSIAVALCWLRGGGLMARLDHPPLPRLAHCTLTSCTGALM